MHEKVRLYERIGEARYKPDKVGSILFRYRSDHPRRKRLSKAHRGPMARARVSGKQRRIEIDVPILSA